MGYRRCWRPTDGPCPRALEIQAELARRDPAGRSLGIYNRRRIRGGAGWSVHACGRAVDWGQSSVAAGDSLLGWLIGPEGPADIQLVIWNHWSHRKRLGRWTFKRYRGSDPHVSHLHIETSDCGRHNA